MSVEKTTVTLLKHQVLSLAQLVVYVVYDEAIASGQATSANLLLVTELSEALMWRLGSSSTSTASGAEILLKLKQCKLHVCMMLTELHLQAWTITRSTRTAQIWQFSFFTIMR